MYPSSLKMNFSDIEDIIVVSAFLWVWLFGSGTAGPPGPPDTPKKAF